MLQYKFFNRLAELKELLKSFETRILKERRTLGYIIKGRLGVGKTRLVEEFIDKLQDVEIMSEIPAFDPSRNIIRYSCEAQDSDPYKG